VNDPELAAEVTKGLIEVRRRIDEATERAGRPRGAVRLIAVSKTKTQAAIRAAYAAGQRAFGENYAQELARKAEELRDLPDLEWHFIGHLQRNKAKQVLEAARAIHTVDRVDLAAELGKRATALGVSLRVLVEVNVAGEASKSGCSPDQIGVVLEAIAKEPSLVAGGLMTIPPRATIPKTRGRC
jgi:pyridoxal phosphate enzyme (YggS family)